MGIIVLNLYLMKIYIFTKLLEEKVLENCNSKSLKKTNPRKEKDINNAVMII